MDRCSGRNDVSGRKACFFLIIQPMYIPLINFLGFCFLLLLCHCFFPPWQTCIEPSWSCCHSVSSWLFLAGSVGSLASWPRFPGFCSSRAAIFYWVVSDIMSGKILKNPIASLHYEHASLLLVRSDISNGSACFVYYEIFTHVISDPSSSSWDYAGQIVFLAIEAHSRLGDRLSVSHLIVTSSNC